MILLDTDHLTFLQFGSEEGTRIRSRLRLLNLSANPPTTIISYHEQVRGWIGRFASAKTVADEVRLFAKLHHQLEFFGTLRIVDFTEAAAVEYQRLKSLKIRVGSMDLKIAAIALANNATVWTRNFVDFRKVPGLNIEDASI